MLLVFHLANFLTEKFETSAQESGHHQPCKALQGWWLESTGFNARLNLRAKKLQHTPRYQGYDPVTLVSPEEFIGLDDSPRYSLRLRCHRWCEALFVVLSVMNMRLALGGRLLLRLACMVGDTSSTMSACSRSSTLRGQPDTSGRTADV